jgi:N-acetyl-anhydromuramyl-L-alanine amidase AmpD
MKEVRFACFKGFLEDNTMPERKINKIIIHCSDSWYGNAAIIDKWHRQRGFNQIGYHFVIPNGYATYEDWKGQKYNPELDGLIEEGRDIEIVGAHCKGHNKDSIGICLIGKRLFSGNQIHALLKVIKAMTDIYGPLNIYGHYEFNPHKTCPNIDMDWLRGIL